MNLNIVKEEKGFYLIEPIEMNIIKISELCGCTIISKPIDKFGENLLIIGYANKKCSTEEKAEILQYLRQNNLSDFYITYVPKDLKRNRI